MRDTPSELAPAIGHLEIERKATVLHLLCGVFLRMLSESLRDS